MDKDTQRQYGAYYTCDAIAQYIADWAIRDKNARLLEPSFGDGEFIGAALRRFASLGNPAPAVWGVEIQEESYGKVRASFPGVSAALMDYLDFAPCEPLDAIIGNPPYVSLKNLPPGRRRAALAVAKSHGVDMQSSASLWMPFVIQATEQLDEGGRLGFVLPYELTYVRYAFPLWAYLGERYGKLSVYRIYKDFFPGVDVETVLLLAEQKGGHTDTVDYRVFESVADLAKGRFAISTSVGISDITSMEKPFERCLLPPGVRRMLSDMEAGGRLEALLDKCKFKIGYVSGNKDYFHPSADTAARYGISERNLLPCLLNAKDIGKRSPGIEAMLGLDGAKLFYPMTLGRGECEYISYGEKIGVSSGYKCGKRNPWYMVPGVETPDVILTVFGDVPKLLSNTGGYRVSNSLLGGFLSASNAEEIICRWYNSLTLLLIELNVHSLGGGSLVLIPGEMDKMKLLAGFPHERVNPVFAQLQNCANANPIDETYRLGDELVLKQIYGFSDSSVAAMRDSVALLRSWRSPRTRQA